MSFPRYPKYKPSGVDWLGDVPEGWEVKKLKHNLRLLTEKTDRRENPVALENIEGWTGRFIPTETKFEGDGVAFDACDILFGKLRPYLAKAYRAEMSGEAVGDFHVMRPLAGIDSRFAQYQILSREFIGIVDGSTFGSKMPRASWEFVGNMKVTTPPLFEQKRIAEFLDGETAKIDALVAEQRRLMALLKEKRQAVISAAVTRGIVNEEFGMKNEQLSTPSHCVFTTHNSPFTPSGIPWLGDVPEHWSTPPLSLRYELQLGKMLDSAKITGNYLREYLRVYDVQWGKINTENLPVMDFDASAQKRFRLRKGDLLVNEGGSYPGRTAIWRAAIDECYYQKALHRLRVLNPTEDIPEFMYYTMVWAANGGVFVAGGNETTIEHLPAEKFRQYRFPHPPLAEQAAIVRYLDSETAKFDALTAEAERAIALLQERRSALISAAVTGQIDVRTTTQRNIS